MAGGLKPLYWVASSKEDLKTFPEEVRQMMGYALYLAQIGDKGFSGGSVLEIVEDHKGDAYRGVYTVRLRGAVYVLHAFKKKAKRAAKTPKHEIDLIRERLKMAQEFHLR